MVLFPASRDAPVAGTVALEDGVMSDCLAGDSQHLASMDDKLQKIRDRVRGVAAGYDKGVYVWGEGGTSKTYTVVQTLDGLGKRYVKTGGRLTARGLFE